MNQVGRTVEQLRKRRHAFLGTYIPPVKERQVQRVDPAEEVGQLKGEVGGVKHALIITLGDDFWIGRQPDCDLVIDDPAISNYHLRIYAVRTSSTQSLICIHDLSTNGFILNDIPYKSTQEIDIGGMSFSPRSVIIRPGDTLRFPDCSIELVCRYFSHHTEATQTHNNQPGQVQCHIPAIFPSSDTTLSRTLDPWVIQNFTLGTGSFGRVHLATHTTIPGLQVACKSVGLNVQIETEIQVLKNLVHPNICGIYDMIEEEATTMIHLFLPLVTGGDLFTYMEKHVNLTEDEGRFAALQLLEAVKFLHEKGIAHRDIKPENVLLHKSGAYPHLLLADFGLAVTHRQIKDVVPKTRLGISERHHRVFTGTLLYVPPERLKAILSRKRSKMGMGESTHGLAAWREAMGVLWFAEETQLDIWAVGLVLFLILTGSHPYDERTDREHTVQPSKPSESSRTATARQSSAQSWVDYRSRNPTGTVGDSAQTEQEKEWRSVEERCARFCKLRSEHWPCGDKWIDLSMQSRKFIAGLLCAHPSNRSSIEAALADPWLSDHQDDLDKIYDTVVTQGKLERASVWNRHGGIPPNSNKPLSTTPQDFLGGTAHSRNSGQSQSSAQINQDDVEVDDSMIRGTPIPLPHGNQEEEGLSELDSPPVKKKAVESNRRKANDISPSEEPKQKGASSSKKKKPEPKTNPKKTPVAAPKSKRPSSLFLNSRLFGLGDIEEAEEDGVINDKVDRLVNAGKTLNDLLDHNADADDVQNGESGQGEESHPLTKAGQRKTNVTKKVVGTTAQAGSSKFQPASKLSKMPIVEETEDSDEIVPPIKNPIKTPIVARKSTFQAPAAKRAGPVVLKKTGKAGKA